MHLLCLKFLFWIWPTILTILRNSAQIYYFLFLFADWTVFSFKFIQGRLAPLQVYTGASGSPSSFVWITIHRISINFLLKNCFFYLKYFFKKWFAHFCFFQHFTFCQICLLVLHFATCFITFGRFVSSLRNFANSFMFLMWQDWNC